MWIVALNVMVSVILQESKWLMATIDEKGKVNIFEIKNARGGKMSKVKVENNRHPGCPASFVVPKILTQSFSDIFQLWLPFMDDAFSSPTDGRETGLIVSSVINY